MAATVKQEYVLQVELPAKVYDGMKCLATLEHNAVYYRHTPEMLARIACARFINPKLDDGTDIWASPVRIATGVHDHMLHARAKHPEFATCFDFKTAAGRRAALAEARETIAECYSVGELPLTVLMNGELQEFFAACHDGDRIRAWHELLDVFVLGLRALCGDGDIGTWDARFDSMTADRPTYPEDDE